MRSSFLLGLIPAATLGFGFSSAAHAELPPLNENQVIGPLDAEITPEPGVGYFGSDVAILGNVAMAGVPGAYDSEGRVGIFVRDTAGNWSRRGTLKANDREPGDSFGRHVAMAIGRRAIVSSNTGVYVFALESGAWRQMQKLTFPSGTWVSDLDWQGNLAAVGVQSDTSSDAAYIFDTSSSAFRRVSRIVGHDAQAADRFGARVAVHGQDIVATAPGYNQEQGAVYTFTCTTSACRERQKLIATEGEAGDGFGTTLEVQQNVLVIGAPYVDQIYGSMDELPSATNYTAGGAAYVFTRNSGTWAESQKLRPTPTEHNWYMTLGWEVAISGNRILLGAPYGMDRYDPGLVFVYQAQPGQPFIATGVADWASSHGSAIKVYGNTAIVGVPDVAPWTGNALIYNLP